MLAETVDVCGNRWRALLADFGAAVNLQGNPKQRLTDTLGTLAYAAPEILSGKV